MISELTFGDISIFGYGLPDKETLPDVKNGEVDWDIRTSRKGHKVEFNITIHKIQINFEDNHELHIENPDEVNIEYKGSLSRAFSIGLWLDDIIIDFDEDGKPDCTIYFGRSF
tara:strand:+ start:2684 stop:3022 length:339 start_codon:yes stop_codon:yes gene_type:complete